MFDTYTRRARLAPAVIAAAPGLAFIVAGGMNLKAPAGITALLVGVVGVLAAGAARDAGRALQPALWESWGGSPTLRRLRWRQSSNAQLHSRLHADIARIVGHPLPTAGHEAQDPTGADAEYEAAIAVLRQRTSDSQTFHKVFAENIEYGFRRNCLGLRPLGLVVAGVGIAMSAGLIIWTSGGLQDKVIAWILPNLVSLAALLFWWKVVTADWVRQRAETYADRLLEAIATLNDR